MNESIDNTREMIAQRWAACETCPARRAGRCLHLGRQLKFKCGQMSVRCPLDRWPELPLSSLVTIGVTAHKRPESLARFLRSVEQYGRGIPVIVQQTGGNLSWGRNQIVDRVRTPYLLICEDDFELTANSDMSRLVDVLSSDEEIAGVGGSVFEAELDASWCYDFDVFRDRCELLPSKRAIRVTAGGTVYRPCDVILNFGLFRTDVLRRYRWDENLPLQEHDEWFYRIAHTKRWRMALCRQMSIAHHCDRNPEYNVDRFRSFRQRVIDKLGFAFQRPSGFRLPERNDMILYGIGHSGTSIVARMLEALGWNLPEADQTYAENYSIRVLNNGACDGGDFDTRKALDVLKSLPSPWVVKDPRFVELLDKWIPVLAQLERPPLLMWLRRDPEPLSESYVRRDEIVGGEPGVRGKPLSELHRLAERNYRSYPWAKFTVELEQIAAAVELFDVGRATPRRCGSCSATCKQACTR